MSAKFIEEELRDLIKNANDDTLLLLIELAREEAEYRTLHSKSYQKLLAQMK